MNKKKTEFFSGFAGGRIKSRCLIPATHLGFCKTLGLKNNTTIKFWLIFLINICYGNSDLAFKSEKYYITSQNCVYFIRENFQYLRQNCKWVLCMRHQVSKELCFSRAENKNWLLGKLKNKAAFCLSSLKGAANVNGRKKGS